MKKLLTVLGIVLLVAAIAYPAFAWGPRWGWGHHRMGYYGHDDRGYGNVTEDQRAELRVGSIRLNQ